VPGNTVKGAPPEVIENSPNWPETRLLAVTLRSAVPTFLMVKVRDAFALTQMTP
jgi:hypothetical protein